MTADALPMPGETGSGRHRRTLAERFWVKVDKTESCWNWIGARKVGGYGTIWAAGRTAQAHRVSYELNVGPIPDGLQLDHLCRNKGCVRPEHLDPVPGWVNYMRGVSPAAANARKTHCAKGHPYTESGLEGPGRRRCTTCARAASKAWRDRQPKRGSYLGRRDSCAHGHLFDESNTFTRFNGSRGCRACRKIYSRQCYERQLLRSAGVKEWSA